MDDDEYDFLPNAQSPLFTNAQDPAYSSPLENYDVIESEDDVLPNAQRHISEDRTSSQQVRKKVIPTEERLH